MPTAHAATMESAPVYRDHATPTRVNARDASQATTVRLVSIYEQCYLLNPLHPCWDIRLALSFPSSVSNYWGCTVLGSMKDSVPSAKARVTLLRVQGPLWTIWTLRYTLK